MRSISIICNKGRTPDLLGVLERYNVEDHWIFDDPSGRQNITFLMDEEECEDLLGALEAQLREGERVLIHAVEGSLPRPKEKEKKEDEPLRIGRFIRVSKNELYEDVVRPAKLTVNLILLVVLSSIVAGIGILQDNTAVVIGAMMIAPLLGPNLALSFGVVLGDTDVIKKSGITGLVFTGMAVLMAIIWGMLTSDVSAAAEQVSISLQDVMLALMCGFAGTISVLSGQAAGLVGVMVAAALMPPLIRGGLLLGAGWGVAGYQSLLLYATNIVCLNLAGIITFYAAGITPGRWWEKESAKKHTRSAFLILLVILVLVMVLIHFAGKLDVGPQVLN